MDIKKKALKLPGTHMDYKEEWEWDRFLIDNKMFAAQLDKGNGPMLTLKVKPEEGVDLRLNYPNVVIEGFYMNKVHWISIYLDKFDDEKLLEELIINSYNLILSGFSKKKQAEILNKN